MKMSVSNSTGLFHHLDRTGSRTPGDEPFEKWMSLALAHGQGTCTSMTSADIGHNERRIKTRAQRARISSKYVNISIMNWIMSKGTGSKERVTIFDIDSRKILAIIEPAAFRIILAYSV